MVYLYYYYLLMLLMITITADGLRTQLRVHKGRNVSHEEYPYAMVLAAKLTIIIPSQHITKTVAFRTCTCSLISPAWVLTAGHCVADEQMKIPVSILRVIYGDLTIPPNVTKFETVIRRIFVYPNFSYNELTKKLKNDIALLLIKPLDVKPLAQLSAVDFNTLIGYPVTYLGAGGTYSLSATLREDLRVMKEALKCDQIRPLQLGEGLIVKCDPKIQLFSDVHPAICLVSKCVNPSQPIQGDSGGPLLFRNKIIGVASMGGSATASYKNFLRVNVGPGGAIYTPVSPYLDWIYSVTSKSLNLN